MVIKIDEEYAMIQISIKTRELLRTLSKKGETYDKIIQRLVHEGEN